MYNHQLDTFLKTADAGSFGKAAAGLYITPPAVIQQINLLEDVCGFKLFERSNHGVRLTPAGKSLYEDAKAIIRMSEDALAKARSIAGSAETTVRIGTSLLYKCRMLPDIWTRVATRFPELSIEIKPMQEYRTRDEAFSQLGTLYDLYEGIYATKAFEGRCGFIELNKQPVCCAVSASHPFSGKKKLAMKDLYGQHLVMPPEGISLELDAFRMDVMTKAPDTTFINSAYYGIDTFTMCEMLPYILITQPVYSDIHTNLITIPLKERYTLPYGLIYAIDPTPATKRFIEAIQIH